MGMNAYRADTQQALHIKSTAGEIMAPGQVWRVERHAPAMYVTRTAAPYKRQGSKKKLLLLECESIKVTYCLFRSLKAPSKTQIYNMLVPTLNNYYLHYE